MTVVSQSNYYFLYDFYSKFVDYGLLNIIIAHHHRLRRRCNAIHRFVVITLLLMNSDDTFHPAFFLLNTLFVDFLWKNSGVVQVMMHVCFVHSLPENYSFLSLCCCWKHHYMFFAQRVPHTKERGVYMQTAASFVIVRKKAL